MLRALLVMSVVSCVACGGKKENDADNAAPVVSRPVQPAAAPPPATPPARPAEPAKPALAEKPSSGA